MLGSEDLDKRRGLHTGSDLEKELIGYFSVLGYEYLDVKSEDDILSNLRKQIQRLNSHKGIVFSDYEWDRFFKECICKAGEEPLDKLKKIQGDGWKQSLVRDDGTTENIQLIDKRNFYNNKLQFINQYSTSIESRGDITILLNGLPMVHIELRRSSKCIESVFSEARPYRRSNFMGRSGLFDFCEIFIISNGSETKYYSSTTRQNYLNDCKSTVDISAATSNSFMFTSYWSNDKNEVYKDLSDFAKTFLEQKNLLDMIINFCVLDTNGVLKIMRPYQVYAVKKIINRIKNSTERGILGKKESGGYIWHATGSGKTLTSFKASRLATSIPGVDKVLFVVDRKDLDHQTQREYGTFEEGSAEGIKSVNGLRSALCKTDQKIIITTIQKLHRYIKKYGSKDVEVFRKHVVLIYDECHRSQFGDMHKDIKESFKNHHIFGFTGTPIFESSDTSEQKTTDHYFGEELHRYTLVNAVKDKNVLKFKVDYLYGDYLDVQDSRRVSAAVRYIIDKFDNKTLRPEHSKLEGKRNRGYNSILCVDSIEQAKRYYREFRDQLSTAEPDKKLVVSTIYSAQENSVDSDMDDESMTNPDTEGMNLDDLSFLEGVIRDYNEIFNTSFSVKANSFNSYYQDLSKRTRDKEVDILIVVNMFLTGFDAPSLNTLWVDKNLKLHGLIQAFSRTNRIHKNIKTFGNIVCFRGDEIEEPVEEALKTYAGGDFTSIVVPSFEKTYEEYKKNVQKLKTYQDVYGNIIVPDDMKSASEYADCFAKCMKQRSDLRSYDEFEGKDLISPEELQKHQAKYLDLKNKYEREKEEESDSAEEAEHDWNIGFELIKQVEITLEYIIDLIITDTKWKDIDTRAKLDAFKERINSMMDSAIYLRGKKEIINKFIDEEGEKTDESFKRLIEKELKGAVDFSS